MDSSGPASNANWTVAPSRRLREVALATSADPNDGRKSLVSVDPQARMEVFAERGARTITSTLAEALPTADAETLARMEHLLAETYAIVQEHGQA